ncbi:threonine--tRNA ligase [Lysinibacillus fusiformis]|uniref:threonine--tRNA ligase n=1 Tax=Lysinibacillus fusiformis TaxID=28031 RepID=UPI00089200A4|nr:MULTISPECIES: threonine--tRNA ligase [Lysinibacillus]MED4669676.1 threonine--tRNA ligase [Lysinibacillus fusiformis]QAS55822.1 threonine--tRNA ligase [Lysinibacillus sphaericus]RDV27830.1 threonine--tRNA ligase [Lysinibacillus fusiformis]SCX42404.1 Ser-tRNA(Thr) hydrolase /threonyl-tRNA synthetase [Lysinibacillus fusiformis]SDB12149.1 Ser-tRNA(Thr) hydrolase /threonyl-tRNA synthetase [Lysinibacillus fusiformis]
MSNQVIHIQFPDGQQQAFTKGVTLTEIAQAIRPELRKKAVAGSVNGTIVDLTRPIMEDAQITLYDASSKEGIEVIRHSTAHLLAQAVKRLYPHAQFGVGPVIENGFYYDIDIADTLTLSDLQQIEKTMKQIVRENVQIKRREVSRNEAKELFAHDALKLELLESIPADETVTIYEQGEFYDLCRGSHVPSTGKLQHFQLMHVSGAYWRGDSDNQMLQRIYGVAFATKEELQQYFVFLDEAEKRNHRKLGKELSLFMFSEEAPGMPFYLANGQILRNELESYLRNLQAKYDYREVRTPLMMNQRLWEQSGHWDHYKDNMYFTQVDDQSFALKPMNCPGHMLIFKNSLHSYRDLPIRMAEFGQVHRHEFSGALNGLLRVRSFCQDDAHIFATPQQIENEIALALKIIDEVYNVFGFQYSVELSTRPDDYMGELSLWDQAEEALENVLTNLGIDYTINEGDGAFYGPKIDIHIKDAIQRSHQCATVQLDFQLPEKFDLTYINEHNEKVRPVVIHRAVFGSIDRFLGILIEHFGGAFPIWLAPQQVQVIAVADAHQDYAKQVVKALQHEQIRVQLDDRQEKLGKKIREAQLHKIPYILVIGDRETAHQNVSVRRHGQQATVEYSISQLIEEMTEAIKLKSL